MPPLHNLFNLPKRHVWYDPVRQLIIAHPDDMVDSYARHLELLHLMSQERTPMRHTSPSTLHLLALGDTVELGGETYKVDQCVSCNQFRLLGPGGPGAFDSGHETLERIADILRKQFAALPKDVPALQVGQKWRTRGGQIVTIEKSRHGDSLVLVAAELPWWYDSHRLSKACHSPGMKPEEDRDTLIELISEAPAPVKSYTIVLTEGEAVLLRDLNRRTSGDPEKSRRGLLKSIDRKLAAINVPVEYNPDVRADLPNSIEMADRVEKVEPIFKAGEVWRGRKGHLVLIKSVEDGFGQGLVIHSPAGTHQYSPNPHTFSPQGGYGRYSSTEDQLALQAKVSP